MCQKCPSRNPIHCIIPPYINQKLSSNKDSSILENAVKTRWKDSNFRSEREFFSKVTPQEMSILNVSLLPNTNINSVNREIYDAGGMSQLPGRLVWKEGSLAKIADKRVQNVQKGAGFTWDFYNKLFSRKSIDNKGMVIRQTINYGSQYNNAFWNGNQMVYGNGDGKLFGDFTSDIDIIGHELTHGVTQFESNLEYMNQSGAINEAISDIFGIMIKQFAKKEDVKTSNWLIGENVLKGTKYALRSLKNPGTAYVNHPDLGTDPQPAHMKNYLNMTDDNGGVHFNSGIINKAFYVMAFNLGGFSWEKMGKIWYAAITDKTLIGEKAQFIDLKKATQSKAIALFGAKSLEAKAVAEGWKAVGM